MIVVERVVVLHHADGNSTVEVNVADKGGKTFTLNYFGSLRTTINTSNDGYLALNMHLMPRKIESAAEPVSADDLPA